MEVRQADDFPTTLSALKISVDRESSSYILTDVHRLAIAYRLSYYDASYLELALRKNLPLAMLDNALIDACKTSGLVLL